MNVKKSDDQIRNRFIRSLGIHASSDDEEAPLGKSGISLHDQRRVILKGSPQEMPLKNHGYEAAVIATTPSPSSSSPSSSSSSPPLSARRGIHFNSVVQVMSIPSHQDYSDRTKRVLWSTHHEIHQNAVRNMREYAFEGWKAYAVLEEHDMILDRRSHEFIHPVHFLGGYWQKQEDVLFSSFLKSRENWLFS